jgi:hypothetical protein
MILRTIPIIFVLTATAIKCLHVLSQSHLFEALGWLLAGVWFLWIAFAYRYDRDLPTIGPSRFESGTNQVARTIAVVSMTGIFILAVIFG